VSTYDCTAPILLRGIGIAGFQADLGPLIENARRLPVLISGW
jgi:hypothetical protein